MFGDKNLKSTLEKLNWIRSNPVELFVTGIIAASCLNVGLCLMCNIQASYHIYI